MPCLSRINSAMVQLTPYGIFAIAAYHAGTMGLGELERLQVYVIVYGVVALLLVFLSTLGLGVAALAEEEAAEALAGEGYILEEDVEIVVSACAERYDAAVAGEK